MRIDPAVLTATSLLRYGAFAETAAVDRLRARLHDQQPALIAADTNIMFTQRPDGALLIGDSHVVEPTVDPFLDEPTSDLILHEVEDVLGLVDRPPTLAGNLRLARRSALPRRRDCSGRPRLLRHDRGRHDHRPGARGPPRGRRPALRRRRRSSVILTCCHSPPELSSATDSPRIEET